MSYFDEIENRWTSNTMEYDSLYERLSMLQAIHMKIQKCYQSLLVTYLTTGWFCGNGANMASLGECMVCVCVCVCAQQTENKCVGFIWYRKSSKMVTKRKVVT